MKKILVLYIFFLTNHVFAENHLQFYIEAAMKNNLKLNSNLAVDTQIAKNSRLGLVSRIYGRASFLSLPRIREYPGNLGGP